MERILNSAPWQRIMRPCPFISYLDKSFRLLGLQFPDLYNGSTGPDGLQGLLKASNIRKA